MPSISHPDPVERLRQALERLPRHPDGSITIPPELLERLFESLPARLPQEPGAPEQGAPEDIPTRIPLIKGNGDFPAIPESEVPDPYRSLFASTLQAMTVLEAVTDPQGELVDLLLVETPPNFTRVTGIPREQALGQPISQVFGSPGLLAPYRDAITDLLATGRSCQLAVYFAPLDRHYQVLLVPLGSRQFAALGFNISPQPKAETWNAYLAYLLENVHDAVVATDANRIVTSWNRGAERLYGWPEADARGRPVDQVIPSGWTPEQRQAAQRDLLEKGGFVGRMVQENREGQKLWVEYHAMALRDADGAVVGYVSVNHDLSERKQAEEASHEEEEMLRLAIQAGQAGVWSWDLTTNDMQWSSEFYRIFGFEPGQVAPSFEAGISRVHPDDRSQVESLVREAIEQGTPIDTIHRLVSAGGPTHWVHGISRAYFDEHGQPVRMAGIAMDVTGQQQAEAQLRESEERFRTSVDTMLDGFAIYSAVRDLASGQIIDFRYEYINEAGCRMNRRAGGDTVGHTLLELLPAHRETGILDEYVQVVETGRPLVRENLVYEDTFGGERLRRVFDHRAVKLGDGFALAWRDVSERQQAEEALRLNEARFRIALQDAPISVATQDRELRYTWAYQPQFGFSPEQMLGKRDDELLAPADVAELVALKQAVLDSGQGVHREIRLHTRQGWKQVVLHAEPVMAASGEVVGVGSAAFDITGQRDLEDTVRQNQTRLEVQRRLTGQREQERLQIARDLHDGPLQDLSLLSVELSSAAQIAKDQPLKAAIQAAIVTLRDQIQELREFTTELRPPLLVRFGLPKAIAAHTKGVQAKNPGLQLHLEVQKETPPLPETTRLALYRIYQEALSNILKHAQATEAWIRFGMDAQAAWLVIQDNGTGFSPPTQWLELARQGHLGLVGMQERAEAVGGSLQIQARPGQGTTLYVTVPISGGLPRPTEGMPG